MYEHLFRPLALNGVVLDNRIVLGPHATRLSGDDLIAYLEARARGGVGLLVLEGAGVHRTSRRALPLYDDRILGFYEQLLKSLRPYEAKVFQQLGHEGSAFDKHEGAGLWSASAIQHPMIRFPPTVMTRGMIDEIVSAFASAAGRAKLGGLHGVEINAAHGYLVGQFLSPALNHRDDDFGGTLVNRSRFLIEILDAMRTQVGRSFHIGVRLSPDLVPGGLDGAAIADVASLIDSRVDHISLSLGSGYHYQSLFDTMEAPAGYQLGIVEPIACAVSSPTMVAGRVMSLDVAEQIVATGTADMVCIVRSLIADPALVNKARGGNARLVRPCIGSNVGCIGRVKTAGRIGCVVNVAAGNEATIDFEPSRAPSAPKRVLIVGGGPAGLEAARTAAMRGHEVTLHEMRTHLGGQIAIAASAPHREGLAAITTWLGDEVARLGVRVERGSRVTAEMVAEFSADEVIIATGTQPTLSAPQVALPAAVVPGGQLPHVYTSWDVLGFGRDVSRATTALVFDDTGTFEAISVALALVRTGASVTFVSSLDMMGARVPLPVATVGHARAILQGSDFTFIPNSGIEAITAVEVMVRPLGTERTLVIPTELVAMVSAHHLNLELCDDLTNVGVAFHAVGDVNGAQDLQVALQQASATARNL